MCVGESGHADGSTKGFAISATEGFANGAANGLANGSANGAANGFANGFANGSANGVANGFDKGVTSGCTTPIVADGRLPPGGHCNGSRLYCFEECPPQLQVDGPRPCCPQQLKSAPNSAANRRECSNRGLTAPTGHSAHQLGLTANLLVDCSTTSSCAAATVPACRMLSACAASAATTTRQVGHNARGRYHAQCVLLLHRNAKAASCRY